MEITAELLQRLRNIEALILDMDGVLVDTEPFHIEAFRQYLNRHGLAHDDAYLFGFIGFSVPDNMRSIYIKFYGSTDEKEIAKSIKERDAIYLQLLRETPLEPLPGIESLIRICRENQIPVALASSSDREHIQIIFENLKRTSHGSFEPEVLFKTVLSGEDVPERKPHPEIYRRVVRELNVKPDHTLAIEDSPAGVQSAKAAGLICLALKSRFIDPEKLNAADLLIDSIFDAVELCRRAVENPSDRSDVRKRTGEQEGC